MVLADDLLLTANELATRSASQAETSEAVLRRAISTAYYAVFHGLCRMVADAVVVRDPEDWPKRAWLHVYRSLDHGKVEQRLGRLVDAEKGIVHLDFPEPVRSLVATFTLLKAWRHRADYDPLHRHTPLDALNAVAQAAIGLQALNALEAKHRVTLGVWLLLDKPRSDNPPPVDARAPRR